MRRTTEDGYQFAENRVGLSIALVLKGLLGIGILVLKVSAFHHLVVLTTAHENAGQSHYYRQFLNH